MMAYAQPTPDFTSIAEKGQFLAQAPHSMQLSLSVITALSSFIKKTSWGHTIAHIPHPLHFLNIYASLLNTSYILGTKAANRINTVPIAILPIIAGTAVFISFITPEKDV